MPGKAPKVCRCGNLVAAGARCPCRRAEFTERKARFDKTRPSAAARGYTGAWQKARDAWLKRFPRCVMCNGRATVVDHRTPHKGDQTLFWDKNNWQSLCGPCHNGAKQRLERKGA